MSFAVIRRFRSGAGPTSSRALQDFHAARALANRWYLEGWEVELLRDGNRGVPQRIDGAVGYPPHRITLLADEEPASDDQLLEEPLEGGNRL
ncbi:MAG: hypothetical protein M3010_04700 [Candidatus Dormibacteraeota bacterium]|nr:hypothetical protein [Candidatus Dormibacteraeota bacterium]